MSFSSLVQKLACGIIIAVPVVVSAQPGFAPLGGEYAIVGALPASQSRPRMSINAGGGYIVWQDQNTFGNRLTVMGRPLNSGLGSSLPAFRVNSGATGDHENPRVALLKDGGAVFVWQGGQFSFQHIYARFLSPSNTWIALDQLVNSSPKTYQANPGVVVLTNGNVVITYATFTTNTMQDVYGQMFSPAGVKIGNEFQINQVSQFNQRSPAIAALANGGFIVTWVSEQQRAVDAENPAPVANARIARPSVDIYARLFGADGAAVNNEFLVNDGFNVCSGPAVAAGADGSVMVAWNSLDVQLPNNGWDIVARPFTFSGNIPQAGTQSRANTMLYGDQHTAQLSASGSTYLALWTSLGQDGNREGVFGQFLNADGSHLGEEIRVNTTTLGMQQQPSVAGDHNGRFLAAWTSPTFGPSKNDLFAQIFANAAYVPAALANNYGSPTFVGQVNAPIRANPVGIHDPALEPPMLDYPGMLAAPGTGTPAANAFASAAGKYSGLFYDLNGVSSVSSGSFTAQVGANKNYSAKLTFAGRTVSLSGKLDDLGNTGTRIIPRPGASALTVSFQVDLFGGDQISGRIQAGSEWNASIHADRQIFKAKTQPTALAGAYTLTVPGFDKGPGGTGVGTIKVGADGGILLKGTLADGRKITQSAGVSKTGAWPLFVPLPGNGIVISWIELSVVDAGGDFAWIKPAAKSGLYPGGFTNGVTAAVGLNPLMTSGPRSLTLSGAGLSQPLSFPIVIDAKGNASVNGVSLAVTPTTGAFTGKVPNPVTGKPAIAINGVLQNGGGGEGFFLGTSESGKVTLEQP